LRESCDAAGVTAEIEVYAGTQHGWCPPDSTGQATMRRLLSILPVSSCGEAQQLCSQRH
jgi:hypothetical protein